MSMVVSVNAWLAIVKIYKPSYSKNKSNIVGSLKHLGDA